MFTPNKLVRNLFGVRAKKDMRQTAGCYSWKKDVTFSNDYATFCRLMESVCRVNLLFSKVQCSSSDNRFKFGSAHFPMLTRYIWNRHSRNYAWGNFDASTYTTFSLPLPLIKKNTTLCFFCFSSTFFCAAKLDNTHTHTHNTALRNFRPQFFVIYPHCEKTELWVHFSICGIFFGFLSFYDVTVEWQTRTYLCSAQPELIIKLDIATV